MYLNLGYLNIWKCLFSAYQILSACCFLVGKCSRTSVVHHNIDWSWCLYSLSCLWFQDYPAPYQNPSLPTSSLLPMVHFFPNCWFHPGKMKRSPQRKWHTMPNWWKYRKLYGCEREYCISYYSWWGLTEIDYRRKDKCEQ